MTMGVMVSVCHRRSTLRWCCEEISWWEIYDDVIDPQARVNFIITVGTDYWRSALVQHGHRVLLRYTLTHTVV